MSKQTFGVRVLNGQTKEGRFDTLSGAEEYMDMLENHYPHNKFALTIRNEPEVSDLKEKILAERVELKQKIIDHTCTYLTAVIKHHRKAVADGNSDDGIVMCYEIEKLLQVLKE